MAMSIRPLGAPDLDALLALYAHLHTTDAPLPARPVVEATWQSLLSQPGHTCFGGFVEGALVCSCVLGVLPNLTRACRPYGVIENVVTHAAHRRRGYGQALLAHALDTAWAAGCYKVMLLTSRKDGATLRFYQSAGFDAEGKQGLVAQPPA